MDYNKGIIYQVITRRFLSIAVILFIFIFGMYSYLVIPKQEYPVMDAPAAIVTVIYPGVSAENIEELVTKKIEDIVSTAHDVKKYSSQVFTGGSVTTVEYSESLSVSKLNENIEDLRIKMEDYKTQDLPSDVSSFSFETVDLKTAALIVAFTSDEASISELVSRAEVLKDELKHMEGVYKVEVLGDREEQIEIDVDMAKLNRTSLNLSDISQIISAQNSVLPIGKIQFDTNKINVNVNGTFDNVEEIGDIIIQVSSQTGAAVKLRDIAEISRVPSDDAIDYIYNGKKAVLLNVYYKDGINMIAVGQGMVDKIEEYHQRIPNSIAIDIVVNLPQDVEKSINNFSLNLIQSIVIILIIIMISMSLRNGAIVSMVIPFTIFVVFIFMKLFNIDIEFVSLAALIISLGMLVDNVIVVSDAIQVRIDDDEDRMSACINGAKEVALPVLTSTITTIAIYSIFYALPGTMASFVASLPTIVIVALSTSYIASMLITPLTCYMFIRKSSAKKLKNNIVRDFFDNLLQLAFKYKIITFTISIVLFAASVVKISGMDLYLLPNSAKDVLDIEITTSTVDNLNKTDEIVRQIESFIQDVPEVSEYLASIGSRVPKYDFAVAYPTKSADTGSFLLIVDATAGGRFKSKTQLTEYLQTELNASIIGAKVSVKELNIVPQSGSPVQVKISGDNFEDLNTFASIIEQELMQIEGVQSTTVDRKLKTSEYFVNINNDMMSLLGLTKAELQNELNIAIMGREVSVYRENLREYPIVLKSNIGSENDLGNFMVASSYSGTKHPLKQVAEIKLIDEYSSISRFNGKRIVTVGAAVRDGYSPDAIQKQLKSILDIKNFNNSELIYEGDSDLLNEVLGMLLSGVVIALMVIFIVLYLEFNSIKQSLIVLVAIPFCLIGATLGLMLFDKELTFFVILGIISLAGVVLNNSIVLVDYINLERKRGSEIIVACKEAVSRRFRPIILSSSLTVFGLMPLVISKDVLFEGMALAFMMGLTVSTLFSLIIVPVLYHSCIKE